MAECPYHPGKEASTECQLCKRTFCLSYSRIFNKHWADAAEAKAADITLKQA